MVAVETGAGLRASSAAIVHATRAKVDQVRTQPEVLSLSLLGTALLGRGVMLALGHALVRDRGHTRELARDFDRVAERPARAEGGATGRLGPNPARLGTALILLTYAGSIGTLWAAVVIAAAPP